MRPDFNMLTIVVDSCRYDTFEKANTYHIDENFDVVSAGSTGTFTYPVHAAMMQGFYPTTNGDRPLYNRFALSVFRWFYNTERDCIARLDGRGSIPKVLRDDYGYRTVCVGGVGWFRRMSPITLGFQDFKFIKGAKQASAKMISLVDKEPFFGLLNFGDTHRPYDCPDIPQDLVKINVPSSTNRSEAAILDESQFSKQVICLQYVDVQLNSIFKWLSGLSKPTIVCFCSDHGDCMGEDGCQGHGFYHHNVMTVPLGWSVFRPGKNGQPVTKTLLTDLGWGSKQ